MNYFQALVRLGALNGYILDCVCFLLGRLLVVVISQLHLTCQIAIVLDRLQKFTIVF
jgi:hypothetical protein